MTKKVYIVLPKLSSYKNKDVSEQQALKQMVIKWIEFYKSTKLSICIFTEDMLAVELLGNDESISWITTIGNADKRFLYTSVEDYPVIYKDVVKDSINSSHIQSALQKFKVTDPAIFKEDTVAMIGDRFNTLSNRIRYVANKELTAADIIVYFKNDNNYCKEPVPFTGDGRIITIVDLKNMLEYFTYGGLFLKEQEFKSVIGGLFN